MTKYLTVAEAADHIGISERQLYNLRRDGHIGYEQSSVRGSVGRPSIRIPWAEAERVRRERSVFRAVKAGER